MHDKCLIAQTIKICANLKDTSMISNSLCKTRYRDVLHQSNKYAKQKCYLKCMGKWWCTEREAENWNEIGFTKTDLFKHRKAFTGWGMRKERKKKMEGASIKMNDLMNERWRGWKFEVEENQQLQKKKKKKAVNTWKKNSTKKWSYGVGKAREHKQLTQIKKKKKKKKKIQAKQNKKRWVKTQKARSWCRKLKILLNR